MGWRFVDVVYGQLSSAFYSNVFAASPDDPRKRRKRSSEKLTIAFRKLHLQTSFEHSDAQDIQTT